MKQSAIGFNLSLKNSEGRGRNSEKGYMVLIKLSNLGKSTKICCQAIISFFFRELFQHNLEGETWSISQIMGKTDAPAVLQRHFPTFGILQRTSHVSQQRGVLPLSMMPGVHEQ